MHWQDKDEDEEDERGEKVSLCCWSLLMMRRDAAAAEDRTDPDVCYIPFRFVLAEFSALSAKPAGGGGG